MLLNGLSEVDETSDVNSERRRSAALSALLASCRSLDFTRTVVIRSLQAYRVQQNLPHTT